MMKERSTTTLNEVRRNVSLYMDKTYQYFMLKAYGVKFENSEESSVQNSLDLLKSSTKSVWILAHEQDSYLWNRQDVLSELNAASSRGVDVKIIFGANADLQEYRVKIHGDNIEIRKLEDNDFPQNIIVDNIHVRINASHLKSYLQGAFVVMDSKILGNGLAKDFKEYWIRSKNK